MNKLFLSMVVIMVVVVVALPLWADNDSADYPLSLQITTTNQVRRPNGSVLVKGKATLVDPSTNSSFALAYSGSCSFGFQAAPTAAKLMNPAKWKKEGSKLSVLWHRVGSDDKLDKCDLDVYDILPHKAYVTGRGYLQLVTEDQLKLMEHPEVAPKGVAKPVDSANVQKLSVDSTPEGADIEVDGAFVGNTPSVLELKAGEHGIVVRKSGFKAWERKLKLAGGDVKVNAELERDVSAK